MSNIIDLIKTKYFNSPELLSELLIEHFTILGIQKRDAKIITTLLVYGKTSSTMIRKVSGICVPNKESLDSILAWYVDSKIIEIGYQNYISEKSRVQYQIRKEIFLQYLEAILKTKTEKITTKYNELRQVIKSHKRNNSFHSKDLAIYLTEIDINKKIAIFLKILYTEGYADGINSFSYNDRSISEIEIIDLLIEMGWIINSHNECKFSRPLDELLLDYTMDHITECKNIYQECVIITNYLTENPEVPKYIATTKKDIKPSRNAYNPNYYNNTTLDINKLDFNNPDDKKILQKTLKDDLIAVGFNLIEAMDIIQLLFKGAIDKSIIINSPIYRRDDCEAALEHLVNLNIVQFSERKNPGVNAVPFCIISVSPYEFKNSILNFIEQNTIDSSDIMEKLPKLISDFIMAYKEGFFKTKYLPEYHSLVNFLSKKNIEESVAKYLALIIIKPDEPIENLLSENILSYREIISAEKQLESSLWIIKSDHANHSYHLISSLEYSLFKYVSEMMSLRMKKANEIEEIVSYIKLSQEKMLRDLKMSEAQLIFLSSLNRRLLSYKKITDEIYDLDIKIGDDNKITVRVCIIELVKSKEGLNTTASINHEKPKRDAEILLVGWYKEAKQFVFWNFAKNYRILEKRSLVVPISIFDLEMGNKSLISKHLPSHTDVITCPEDQIYKAIKYWLNKKDEIDDNWFI